MRQNIYQNHTKRRLLSRNIKNASHISYLTCRSILYFGIIHILASSNVHINLDTSLYMMFTYDGVNWRVHLGFSLTLVLEFGYFAVSSIYLNLGTSLYGKHLVAFSLLEEKSTTGNFGSRVLPCLGGFSFLPFLPLE